MKRIIIGIICGLMVVVMLQMGLSMVGTLISIHAITNLSPIELDHFYKSLPIQMVFTLLYVFSFLALVLSGIVTGFLTRKNGMKYGLLIGAITILFPLIVIIITLATPQPFYGNLSSNPGLQRKILNSIVKIVQSIPVTLTLTAMGGYIGEKLSKKRFK